jgi:hypothetical protein
LLLPLVGDNDVAGVNCPAPKSQDNSSWDAGEVEELLESTTC